MNIKKTKNGKLYYVNEILYNTNKHFIIKMKTFTLQMDKIKFCNVYDAINMYMYVIVFQYRHTLRNLLFKSQINETDIHNL